MNIAQVIDIMALLLVSSYFLAIPFYWKRTQNQIEEKAQQREEQNKLS